MSLSGGVRAASRLNLVVRSHDKDTLNAFVRMLPVGGPGKGIVRLPTKTQTWTVNKSPHVHSKSKESFRRFMHRVLIPIEAPNHITLRWITAIRDAGVFAKVSFKLEVSGGGRSTNEKDGKRGIDRDRVRYSGQYLRDRAAGNLEGLQLLSRDRWQQRFKALTASATAAPADDSTASDPSQQPQMPNKNAGLAVRKLLGELIADAERFAEELVQAPSQAANADEKAWVEAVVPQLQARQVRWLKELRNWDKQTGWHSSLRFLRRRAEWEGTLMERAAAVEQRKLTEAAAAAQATRDAEKAAARAAHRAAMQAAADAKAEEENESLFDADADETDSSDSDGTGSDDDDDDVILADSGSDADSDTEDELSAAEAAAPEGALFEDADILDDDDNEEELDEAAEVAAAQQAVVTADETAAEFAAEQLHAADVEKHAKDSAELRDSLDPHEISKRDDTRP